MQGLSTSKKDKLAKYLGIENQSSIQVDEMTKGLNEQVHAFRERPLTEEAYPVHWVDSLYENMRYSGRVVSMAFKMLCGVNTQGRRKVLADEPMLEETKDTYQQVFDGLKSRCLQPPSLVVSDAHNMVVRLFR